MNLRRLFQSLVVAVLLPASPAVRAADDLAALAGQWSVKKVNEGGQEYTQTVTVKKDKFVFEILASGGPVFIHAEGDLRLEKLGPFNAVHFTNLRAGASATDLQPIDEEFVSIYRLQDDTLSLTSNFEKDRDGQKPGVDAYRRVKAAAPAATLVIDEIEVGEKPPSGTWYVWFEATVGGVTRSFHIPGKGYDTTRATIPVALEFPGVGAGQTCSFKFQLDDVDEDAATEEADNKSKGEFTVKEKGDQAYKPQDDWRYTVRWHLK